MAKYLLLYILDKELRHYLYTTTRVNNQIPNDFSNSENARAHKEIIMCPWIFSYHHGFETKKKVQKHAYWKVSNGYIPSIEIIRIINIWKKEIAR